MAMTVGELVAYLRLDDTRFGPMLDKAQNKLSQVGSKVSQAGKSMTTGLTLPLVGVGAAMLKSAGDFEAGMNRVKALSGATGEEFAKMEKLAQDLGATTKYSASEAADAMSFLAMTGFSASETMQALPGVLDLAAAGNLDLAQSADIASNILSSYKLKAEDLGKVNDILAKTFVSSNVDLTMLGESFKYVGPVAQGFGIKMEEISAAIGLLGNAGIQGSMAGTGLASALAKLAKPTGEAAKTLQRLGVQTVDSKGKLRSLADIFQGLEKGGASTTDMITIFGLEAGPKMAALLGAGSDQLRKFTKDLENSGGTANRIAEESNKGLNHELRQLGAAFEGLSIAIAKSGLITWATDFVRKIGGLVQGLSKTNPEMLRLAVVIGGVVAAIGPALIIFGKMAEGMSAVIKTGRILVGVIRGITAAMLANPIGLIVAGLIALGVALYAAYQKFEGFKKVVDSTFGWIKDLVGKFASGDWSGAWAMIVQLASDAWEKIKQGAAAAWDWIKEKAGQGWDAMLDWLKELPGKAWAGLQALGQIIGDWIAEKASELGAKAAELGEAFLAWLVELPGKVTSKAVETGKAIADWLKELPGKIRDKGVELGAAAVEWLQELPGKIRDKAAEVGNAIAEWVQELPGKIADKASEIGEAVAAWVKGLPEKIGPWLDAAKDAIIEWGKSLPDKIRAAIGTGEQIIEWLKEWGPKIALGLAIAFGVAVLAVPALIAGLFAAIALVVGTVVVELGKTLWEKFTQAMDEAGKAVSSGIDKVVTFFRELPGKAMSAVSGLAGQLTSWAGELLSSLTSKFAELRDGTVAKFGELKDKAIATAGELVTWMKGLPGRIKDGLGNLGTLLVQSGKDLLTGLWNGVQSMAGWLKDKVTGFFGGLLPDWAKDAMGIASPSKVFAELGKWTIAGFNKGMQGEQGKTKQTVDGLVKLVKDAFRQVPSAPDALVEWVGKNTTRLQEIAKKREEIIQQIADAKKYAADIENQMREFASVADLGLGEGAGAGDIVSGLNEKLNAIKQFATDIQQLAKSGLNKTTLQQIIDAGPEKGLALAEMLVGADGAEIKAINKAQKQIDKVSKQMGKNSADALYDVGKKAGDGFLKGLQGQMKQLEGMMAQIAKAVVAAAKKELGVKSPSRVFMDIGDDTVAGFIEGIAGKEGQAVATMSSLVGAVTAAGGGGTVSVPGLAAVAAQPMAGPSPAPAWAGGYGAGGQGQDPRGGGVVVNMPNAVIREQADIGRLGSEFAFQHRNRG